MLAHRIVGAFGFLLVLLAALRRWAWLGQVVRQPRVLAAFLVSAVLLSINWLAYIWAVGNAHVVDASLGYFMTPLVNAALGYVVLHERLRRSQAVALALAACGVGWLTLLTTHPPWVALVLAGSFGVYGLLRKVATLGALEGLTLETLILVPGALVGLWWLKATGEAVFPAADAVANGWLLLVGPITAVPLLLFAAGARRLPLATLGILQYLSPTLQFLLGVWLFHEPFSLQRLLGFCLIWLALLIYTADAVRVARKAMAAPA